MVYSETPKRTFRDSVKPLHTPRIAGEDPGSDRKPEPAIKLVFIRANNDFIRKVGADHNFVLTVVWTQILSE